MTDREERELLLQRIRNERAQLRRDLAHYRNWNFYPVDVVSPGRPRNLRFARIWGAVVLAAFAIMPFVLRYCR